MGPKAKSNLRKHRVSFETAVRVFADPFAMVEQNCIENEEYRWKTLGIVEGSLPLTDEQKVELKLLSKIPDSKIDYGRGP